MAAEDTSALLGARQDNDTTTATAVDDNVPPSLRDTMVNPQEVSFTSVAVTSEPSRPTPSGAARGPMSEATLDAVARMVADGATTVMIAAATGRSEGGIRDALANNPTLQLKVEEARGLLLRGSIIHNFELRAALPEVRAALLSGLRSADENARLNTAKWIHEQLMPKPGGRHEVDVNLRAQVQTDQEITTTLVDVSKSLALIAAAREGQPTMLSRVKSGREALPRAVPLLDVSRDDS